MDHHAHHGHGRGHDQDGPDPNGQGRSSPQMHPGEAVGTWLYQVLHSPTLPGNLSARTSLLLPASSAKTSRTL